jgi:hypothetical protein
MMKTKGNFMKLKNILWAVVLAIAPYGAYAQDKTAPVVIAAGMQGGGYDKFAKTMAQRLAQRGYDNVSVTNNNGSDAITLAACNGKADVAITQIDAIYSRFQEGCALTPVADYGTEYAVILFPPESDSYKLSHLTEGDSIAVDGLGSGSELLFKTIVAIENSDEGDKDSWSKTTPVESSPDQLTTMANFGDIQAAILVRKTDSQDIVMLLEQGWKLGELWDRDIDELMFNNKPLYDSVEPTIKYSAGSVSNYAYAVRSFVVVTKEHSDNRPFKMDISKAAQ